MRDIVVSLIFIEKNKTNNKICTNQVDKNKIIQLDFM